MSAELQIAPEVSDAWSRLTQDSSAVSWIMLGYNAENQNQLMLKSEGSGGMPEFKDNLPSDDIVWGAFKVVGVDNRGNTVSRRPKYIFVKYLPADGIPAMKKARTGRHKGTIKQVISNAHIDVEIESKDDLTEEFIIQKLRASGGAHQPTDYEFSNYSS